MSVTVVTCLCHVATASEPPCCARVLERLDVVAYDCLIGAQDLWDYARLSGWRHGHNIFALFFLFVSSHQLPNIASTATGKRQKCQASSDDVLTASLWFGPCGPSPTCLSLR